MLLFKKKKKRKNVSGGLQPRLWGLLALQSGREVPVGEVSGPISGVDLPPCNRC